jgi:hypothetical protein
MLGRVSTCGRPKRKLKFRARNDKPDNHNMETSNLFALFNIYKDIKRRGVYNGLTESCQNLDDDVIPVFTEIRRAAIRALHDLDIFFDTTLQMNGTKDIGDEIANLFVLGGYEWEDDILTQETRSSDSSSDYSSMDSFIEDSEESTSDDSTETSDMSSETSDMSSSENE